MLSPPPSTCQSPSSNMYSTCRALQSLLANNLPTLSPTPKLIRASPPHLDSPIVLTTGPRAQPKKTKSHTVQHNGKIMKPQPRTPPRSNLKRRRSSSSSSSADNDDPPRDQNDLTSSIPSTPKRQRLCPPTLPLGLDRNDFAALSSNPIASSTPPHTPAPNALLHTPSRQIDQDHEKEQKEKEEAETEEAKDQEQSTWSTPDDAALVSLILNKLRLRQSDWDECARTLGKESGSLGRRWKYLLGDGEVGLRRGRGERVRGEVGKMVFGPPLGGLRSEEE